MLNTGPILTQVKNFRRLNDTFETLMICDQAILKDQIGTWEI
jgi:hypothetical protein